jgi:hypothetical protein
MTELPRRSYSDALTELEIALHALGELVHVDAAAARILATDLETPTPSVLDFRAAALLRRLADESGTR